jgi:large subunit ribosomal protein L21
MYAVIESGGKQYRVSPGQTLELELLPALPGSEVALERVLLVATGTDTIVGRPLVPGGRVVGTVVREGRGKKVLVFKFRAKKRYRRLSGHRQDYTYLTVTDIQANGASLVDDMERKRWERLAQRAVNRFEAHILAQVGEDVDLETEDEEAAPMAPAMSAPQSAARTPSSGAAVSSATASAHASAPESTELAGDADVVDAESADGESADVEETDE